MLDSNDNSRPVAPWLSAALDAMLRASDGILDMLPIATFICDAQGTILQYNTRAVEIWGRVRGRDKRIRNSPRRRDFSTSTARRCGARNWPKSWRPESPHATSSASSNAWTGCG